MRAEQAEQVAGRGVRGVVHEWVEQQLAGAWEARAINVEAANRDLEAHLSRANEDRRDSESRLADVTKERDRLATKVKTLERDLATLRKAKPAAQPAEAVERPEGAEAPPSDGGGGGAVPPVSDTSWPAQRRGMPRPRRAPRHGTPVRRPGGIGSVPRPADGHDGQWQAGRCGQRGPRRPQGDCRTGGSAPPLPPPTASRRQP